MNPSERRFCFLHHIRNAGGSFVDSLHQEAARRALGAYDSGCEEVGGQRVHYSGRMPDGTPVVATGNTFAVTILDTRRVTLAVEKRGLVVWIDKNHGMYTKSYAAWCVDEPTPGYSNGRDYGVPIGKFVQSAEDSSVLYLEHLKELENLWKRFSMR